MSSLRFGKNQLAFLKGLLEAYLDPVNGPPSAQKAEPRRMARDLLDKLEKSELVKKKSPEGLGWYAAYQAMEGVATEARSKVALPPNPTLEWKGWMSGLIRKYGLTADHCRDLARGAIAKGWRPLNFELLIKNAVRYLAEDFRDSENTFEISKRGPLDLEEL